MKFLSLLLAMSVFVASNLSAQDYVICPMVVPSSAGLSADGRLGISYAYEEVNPFSNLNEIDANDACFGEFSVNLMLNACNRFLAKYDKNNSDDAVDSGDTSEAVLDCSNQENEIAKLKKANRRLKGRLRSRN